MKKRDVKKKMKIGVAKYCAGEKEEIWKDIILVMGLNEDQI